MKPLTRQMYIDYRESLQEHIRYVYEAGMVLGVPTSQLDTHDLSKFSPEEFEHYVRQFKGTGDDPDGFARAWLHHLHHNEHHWQHWMFPDNYTPKGSSLENGIVEMPKEYCLEMIADWLGASKGYTGRWDMTSWLKENFAKVKLHSVSHPFVVDKLAELGYYDLLIELGYYPTPPAKILTVPFR